MKYTITIPEPCHENWYLMTPTEKGRFCDSCQKEVFDFTKTSTYQLAKILDNNGELCGRFRASQLNKSFNSNETISIPKASLIFGITSLLTLCTPVTAQKNTEKTEIVDISTTGRPLIINELQPSSKTETIKGTVVDSDHLPLPGAKIVLEGTTMGTQTDFDGNYKLVIPAEAFDSNKKLIVSYIGFETKEICLNKLEPEIRLELELSMQESFVGGVVIVRKWNIFNRIANLFRKKYKYQSEESERLSCEIDKVSENEKVIEKAEDLALLNNVTIDKEVEDKQSSLVWPNPASNEIQLKYQMEEDGVVNIQLFPINRMENKLTLIQTSKKKGQYQESFKIDGLQNGLYALIISKNGHVEEHKLIVEKK